MKIVYASDDNYFPYVYASVKTLFESNDVSKLSVCYIEQDVSEKNKSFLRGLAEKYSASLEIRSFEMPEVYDRLPAYASSKTTWAKFLFASMFPNDDRVLFLDPDTLVLGDVSELETIDFEDNLIGGVPECLPKYHRDASRLSDDDIYINGGVVLCNLLLWRIEDFEKKALIRLQDTSLNLNYDQGVINELCKGRVLLLNAKYDVLAEMFQFKSSRKLQKRYGFKRYYTNDQIVDAVENPIIVHFTGYLYLKPFSKNCTHPYAKKFWEIMEESPLQFKCNDKKLNKKQLFRKWVLEHMPFGCFLIVEQIFDIRRRILLNRTK